jgi:hypothetical protein
VANASACTGTFLDSSGVFTGYSGNYTNNTGTFAADSGLFAGYSGNFVCVVTYGDFAVVVATGDIPAGSPVIGNNDGTVSVLEYVVVSEETTETETIVESIPAGSITSLMPNMAYHPRVLFDPNDPNKFIFLYNDLSNSLYKSVVVGTISNNTITYGSVQSYDTNSADTEAAFNPAVAGEFVVVYRSTGAQNAKLKVGTISGTSVSFSTEYTYNTYDSYYADVKFDPSGNGKFIISCWIAPTTPGSSQLVVGTMTEGVPSFGTAVTFKNDRTLFTSLAFDPDSSGKFVVGYIGGYGGEHTNENPGANYCAARAGVISGTSVVLGSEAVFSVDQNSDVKVLFGTGTADKFLVMATDGHSGGVSRAGVGTLTGTAISFGVEQSFNDGAAYQWSAALDSSSGAGRLIAIFLDYGNDYTGVLSTYTMVGDVLTHDTDSIVSMPSVGGIAFDPNNPGRFVYTYSNGSTMNSSVAVGQLDATIVTVTPAVEETNLTEDNFTGVAEDSFTDGQTGRIITKNGVVFNLTGLVQGTTYYVLADGSISDTPDIWNVVIGIALSSTSLLLT